jgi:hypothetical protein
MKEIILPLATHASLGTAATDSTEAILGRLYAIEYRPNTIATGATLTVTCRGFDAAAKPLLTKANAGTADSWYYPRDIVHGVEDGAVLTGGAGGDQERPLLQGIPRAAIATGGNSKAGTVILYWEPL